ncbi:hypothetical protein SALBM135S_04971 [Streptomyces alboniger]
MPTPSLSSTSRSSLRSVPSRTVRAAATAPAGTPSARASVCEAPTGTSEERRAAEPPLPVQSTHGTQQRPVVADHDEAARTPSGQRFRKVLRPLGQARTNRRARAEYVLRDPYRLTVRAAGDRVDDD